MLFRKVGLNWSKALGIAIASTVGFYANSSFAQITPDGTLPTNSNVTSEGNTRTITGGTQAGGNLFHSFTEFSVPTGSEAFFNNGADIQNIINRVTGGSTSDIDGLIRANGGANLFLINPNGIVFGPNARLNIGGSFYGTSANSIKFANGDEFSAVNPQSPPPLLTINVPLGLQLGTNPVGLQYGNNPGNITVGNDQTEPTADSPTLLEVLTGETLALVGGDVNVNGQRLRAPGGRIELGGLASEGTVGINNDGSLTFPDGVARADVSLNGGELDVTAGGGGSIGINARNINLLGGSDICAGIGGNNTCGGLASDTGSVGSQAGDITLNATGDITGDEGVLINNRVNRGATGNSGNINIGARSLSMTDGAQISASTFGQGNAGSVTINANDLVKFDGEDGNGNNSGAFSQVGSNAVGNGGGISITTGSLEVTNGAQINTLTSGQGDAGNIMIKADDLVKFDGSFPTGAFSQVRSEAEGNAGSVSITTGSLEVLNGAQLSASTFGQGNAGKINITTGSLILTNSSAIDNSTLGRGDPSGIFITAKDTISLDNAQIRNWIIEEDPVGSSEGINITTDRLLLNNGAQITAPNYSQNPQVDGRDVNIRAFSEVSFDGVDPFNALPSSIFTVVNTSETQGDGGDINITTDIFSLSNGAVMFTETNGIGNAGDVNVNATNVYLNRAKIDSSARIFAQGNAGDIIINANSIRLDNNTILNANTRGVDRDSQANINIRSRDLILRDGSNITTNAIGDGGNININTGVLAGFENSNITANSADARGGNIQINAEGVFNMQFREEDSPLTSDITATGVNNELSGNVEIDTTESDPTRGLGEVEADTVDASNQIYDPCVPGNPGFGSSFVSVGRGGLPMSPTEPLQDTSTISAWVRLKPQSPSRTNKTTTNRKTINRTTSSQATTTAKTPKVEKQTEAEKPTQIVEATGWIVNAQGNIEFVAQANHTNPTSPWQNPASCSVSSEK